MLRALSSRGDDALHAVDAVDALEPAHDVLELIEVRDVELEGVDGAVVVGGATVRLRDVDPALREALRDDREQARLVGAHDLDGHGPLRLALAVPLDVDAALGIEIQRLLALPGVHGHAAPARDEADDGVAGQRVAALGVAHEHVALARDLDAGRHGAARDLADELGDRVGRDLRVLVGAELLALVRHQDVRDLPGRDGAGAELAHRLIDLAVAGDLVPAHAPLAQLALEELLAQAAGALALLGAQQVPDLRLGARGDDELQPVLVGLLVRAGDDLDGVAVPELVAERHDDPVHPRPRALVADG